MTTISADVTAATEGMGLRERKKLRTRQTIERVALELFAERGFHATTLTQIAEAAEVAPSTLHAYFPSKDDMLFAMLDAARESVRQRLAARPAEATVVMTLQAWLTEDMPQIAGADLAATLLRRTIIDSDEVLVAQERLRLALFEDVLAEAFALDLGEASDGLRSRLMAAVAVNGLRAVSLWWYRHHTNGAADPRYPYELDATYVTSLLEAAGHALEALPSPPEHVRQPSA
jgi:AcrR family transcriptional regulator